MKKIVIIALRFIFVLLLVVIPVHAQPTKVWVDDDGPDNGIDQFDTIQEGINAVAIGGTVHVASGTYAETLSIGKALALTGNGRDTTIIDAGGSGPVIGLTADHVTVSGLTMQNWAGGSANSGAIYGTFNNCTIAENRFKGTIGRGDYGLWTSGGSNTVTENMFTDIGDYAGDAGGPAIKFGTGAGSYNIVRQNQIIDSRGGIWIYGGGHHDIFNNVINSNRCGIFFFASANNEVHDNEFSGNIDAIQVWHSSSNPNIIRGNTIMSNADDGIEFWYGAGSFSWGIHYNDIYDNGDHGVVGGECNATKNWWSDASGPSGGVTDPITGILAEGEGDRIGVNVHFDPWAEIPYFADLPEPEPAVLPAALIQQFYGLSIVNIASGGTFAVQDGIEVGMLSLERGTHTIEVGVSNIGLLDAHNVSLKINAPEGMKIEISPKSTTIER
ncbi:MAG: right-handed parallel beta-helix repeat-containing protein, partial [Euryarchaeota archaeon]|nr:right-handed parallel beta-helix repeat-containing protein [Euryarchaeota archaeon]